MGTTLTSPRLLAPITILGMKLIHNESTRLHVISLTFINILPFTPFSFFFFLFFFFFNFFNFLIFIFIFKMRLGSRFFTTWTSQSPLVSTAHQTQKLFHLRLHHKLIIMQVQKSFPLGWIPVPPQFSLHSLSWGFFLFLFFFKKFNMNFLYTFKNK